MKIMNAREAEKKKAEGNEFYKKKDFINALKYYNEASDMNPDELIFYSNIAAVHIETKDYASAIKSCDKGIEKAKGTNYDYVKLAKVMARKASALEKSGDLEASNACYQSALLENNDSTIKDAMKRMQKLKKE